MVICLDQFIGPFESVAFHKLDFVLGGSSIWVFSFYGLNELSMAGLVVRIPINDYFLNF